MTLLELVLLQMNRRSAPELQRMDKWERLYLAEELSSLSSPDTSRTDWNELARALLRLPPRSTARQAKEELLYALRASG